MAYLNIRQVVGNIIRSKKTYIVLNLLILLVGAVYTIMPFFGNFYKFGGTYFSIVYYFFGYALFITTLLLINSEDNRILNLLYMLTLGFPGYLLMMIGIINGTKEQILALDMGYSFNIYFAIYAILFLIAVIGLIIFIFSNSIRNKFKYPNISLVIILFTIIFTILFPNEVTIGIVNLLSRA